MDPLSTYYQPGMASRRRFRQGDGQQTIVPNEVVLLDYFCHSCGRVYEIAIRGGSQTALLDCNEERVCEACEKKSLAALLLERGTTVPEEQLLTMTLHDLQSLAVACGTSSEPATES
jgi:hypothetical protein